MKKVAQLNDALRSSLFFDIPRPPANSQIVMTQMVAGLDARSRTELFMKVATCHEDPKYFSRDNNPYGERDFGVIEHEDEKYNWKIDYYDLTMNYLSEDPADETKTIRVLTIMHWSEN